MNRPMFIDGLTYVGIAFFGAVASALSSDEAYQFIAPERLFWLRNSTTAIAAALLALKMFRSTTYSDALWDKKKAEGKLTATNPEPKLEPKPLNPL